MDYNYIHMKRWKEIRSEGKFLYVLKRAIVTEIGVAFGFIISYYYDLINYEIIIQKKILELFYMFGIFYLLYYIVYNYNEKKYVKATHLFEINEVFKLF